ncbi:hypothetical protein [Clostridium senegalense]|nr:hypothetical protein [Clostridium senegalense]
MVVHELLDQVAVELQVNRHQVEMVAEIAMVAEMVMVVVLEAEQQ